MANETNNDMIRMVCVDADIARQIDPEAVEHLMLADDEIDCDGDVIVHDVGRYRALCDLYHQWQCMRRVIVDIIRERDLVIEQRDAVCDQRDAAIGQRNAAIEQRDACLTAIETLLVRMVREARDIRRQPTQRLSHYLFGTETYGRLVDAYAAGKGLTDQVAEQGLSSITDPMTILRLLAEQTNPRSISDPVIRHTIQMDMLRDMTSGREKQSAGNSPEKSNFLCGRPHNEHETAEKCGKPHKPAESALDDATGQGRR